MANPVGFELQHSGPNVVVSTRDEVEGVPPMRYEPSEVQWNWTAIISFGVSTAVSLAMWAGIIRAFSLLRR